MSYVIECRAPSNAAETLEGSGARELGALLNATVYFARTFSCADGPTAEELRPEIPGITDDINGVTKRLPANLYFKVERVEISEGSVVILILAAVVIHAHVGGAVGIGGKGVWVADKLCGGALGALGSTIAEKVAGRVKNIFSRKGLPEPKIDIANPNEIADKEAERLTAQQKCKFAPSNGGARIGEDCYEYTYDLVDCGARRSLVITVCPGRPIAYKFFR